MSKGVTLLELLVTMAMASLLLTVSFAFSIPMLAREKTRGALRDVQVLLQLARSEAVSRNRAARFVVDPGSGTLWVYDTNGTPSNTADDVVLHKRTLSRSVGFARPEGGDAITLADGDGSTYQTIFDSSGAVSSGTGSVFLYGGEHYVSLTLYGAGGTQVAQWQNGSWEQGL